jgi:hypothetical protein
VQDGGHQRVGIQAQIGKDVGDGDRVRDVPETRFWP